MTVADVAGVRLAGVMIDAGPVSSPVLLEVGTDTVTATAGGPGHGPTAATRPR